MKIIILQNKYMKIYSNIIKLVIFSILIQNTYKNKLIILTNN